MNSTREVVKYRPVNNKTYKREIDYNLYNIVLLLTFLDMYIEANFIIRTKHLKMIYRRPTRAVIAKC